MRARNLKPGLFKNEILGSADPLLTLLFEGLWCSADREGRLEDRPLRLCATIFPYRRAITGPRMDKMLGWLHECGFIMRYTAEGRRCIHIPWFLRHQRPHKNEAASVLPAPYEIKQGPDPFDAGPRLDSEHNQGSADFALNPSSLTPDSGLLTDESRTPYEERARGPTDDSTDHEAFQRLKAAYPAGTYPQADWLEAERDITRRVEEGASWMELEAGVMRYRDQLVARDKVGSEFVFSPKKFFTGRERLYREAWPLPKGGGRRKSFDERMKALGE